MWQWLMAGGAVLVGLLALLVIWSLLAMAAEAEEAIRITGCKPVPPGGPAEHE